LRKRGWSSIIADILEATGKPERKMRIMYKSNLNFARFNKYFYDLLEKGFLEETVDSSGHSFYKISKRGKDLLDALKKVEELFSPDDCC
jgi:predicted transcriptional regulator